MGVIGFFVVVLLVIIASGIRIIRPTHKGVIERLGRYRRVQGQGITVIIPFIDKMYPVNITERITDIETQEIITQDNLNAMVDLQVYYKVRPDDDSVKKSQYNVWDYKTQIIALARTTMRNVIGNKPFADVNSKRNELNVMLRFTMQQEVDSWGIDIVRCELKEIRPPANVQDAMNNVLVAQNTKNAAIDFATATETKADGEKRAVVKKAEGDKQSAILRAEGQATAIQKVADADAYQIKIVNESAEKYFTGNAQKLKRYEVTQASLENNSKIVITEEGITPVIVLGKEEVIPIDKKEAKK